jgi:hypothetical protein
VKPVENVEVPQVPVSDPVPTPNLFGEVKAEVKAAEEKIIDRILDAEKKN